MAKRSGLGQQLYIDGYDLSGDIGSLDSISGTVNPLITTGIDKQAFERIGGQRDGKISFMSFFNSTAAMSHDRLSNLPTTDVQVMFCTGTTIGQAAANVIGKQINFDGTRGDDGSFTLKTEVLSSGYGLEWGELLTAGKSTLGSAGNITSYDYGAGVGTTNFGLQAYLQVFAFTGTSATVNIQSSTDNGSGDAFSTVTGASFAAASAIGVQRIATGGTAAVERYLRVNVTGTFSNFVFAVCVCRNLTATVF